MFIFSLQNALSSHLARTRFLGLSSVQFVRKFSGDVGTIYLFLLKYRIKIIIIIKTIVITKLRESFAQLLGIIYGRRGKFSQATM